ARYRLCCVANQPAQARELLRRQGFERYLEHVLLDTVVGASKPDPGIFHQALARMQARPEEVVFVGDRLDNDVVPARRLGMRTVWLRRTPHPFVPDGVDEELAAGYHQSLRRAWHHNTPTAETTTPDLIGEELACLVLPASGRPPWTY